MKYEEQVISYFGAYLAGAIITALFAVCVFLYEATLLEAMFGVLLFGAAMTIFGLLWGEFEPFEEDDEL